MTVYDDLERELGALLFAGNRASLRSAAVAGAGVDLEGQEYAVLSALGRLGPRTAARLAADLGIDRSGVTRYADRLAASGLLARSPDPSDRRATLLTLTPAGRRTVERMRAALTAELRRRLTGWRESDAERLVDGLRALTGN